MSMRYSVLLALVCLVASAGVAHAKGKLTKVEAVTVDPCVQEPSASTDQFWDVEPGKTYRCTIKEINDCANDGTDATIGIRVNATGPGSIELTADNQAPGEYQFTITIPANNPSCTLPIFYCAPAGTSDPGLRVLRSEDGDKEYPAHFRLATFQAGCTNPSFPFCSPTPARSRTWAQVKQIYR